MKKENILSYVVKEESYSSENSKTGSYLFVANAINSPRDRYFKDDIYASIFKKIRKQCNLKETGIYMCRYEHIYVH